MSYTKLANSILTSTIWMEDDQTRIVWLTLLAMADKNGEVQASIPGLANVARVSVESCHAAIDKFLAPDPYSRTKDDEGRRIEEIRGGWSLINHAEYRNLASDDDRKMKAAERQRRHRERYKRNSGVTACDKSRQNPQADTDTDTDTEEKKKEPRSPKGKVGQCEEILDVFNSAFKLQCRMTASRRKTLLIRLKDEWWSENWQAAIEKGSRSDFLTGKNDRGWKIDFEFFLKPETVTKILEGKYSPAEQKKKPRLPDYTTPEGMAQLKKDFLDNLHT